MTVKNKAMVHNRIKSKNLEIKVKEEPSLVLKRNNKNKAQILFVFVQSLDIHRVVGILLVRASCEE